MSDAASEHNPLRAFVRGTWILLVVQLAVAAVVFSALTYASLQLKRILQETAEKQVQLEQLRTERATLETSLAELSTRLQNAHDATPVVRGAIIAFHNRQYEPAIEQYQRALSLDPANPWVRDLMSYSQYMAGRTAQRTGDAETGMRRFAEAVASVSQVLQEVPGYLGGYVELAIYQCARDQEDAALAAYERALSQSPAARDEFANRVGEIPQRCTALHTRLRAQ